MMRTVSHPAAIDTPQTADFRRTVHEIGTAACIALLLYAAELALDTLPEGAERERTRSALELASRIPAGLPIDPYDVVDAMQNEDDEGPVYYEQVAPSGPQANAWSAVSSALGTAAWNEYLRRDLQPAELLDGFNSPDSLDFSVDMFVGIPDLDWEALARATDWLREHAPKVDEDESEGWGEPLRIEDLRQAAEPRSVGYGVG